MFIKTQISKKKELKLTQNLLVQIATINILVRTRQVKDHAELLFLNSCLVLAVGCTVDRGDKFGSTCDF